MNDSESKALVIATYGHQVAIRLADQSEVRARIKGRKLKPVCGDRVEAEAIIGEPEWLITKICLRSNELTRPDSRGKTEVLAANISFLVVVASDTPAVDWFIVDRYLAAAESMRIGAMVLFNKTDLGEPSSGTSAELRNYEAIGYRAISCSAKDGFNTDQVAAALKTHCAIIVGQSGVGKSSLINRLTATDTLSVGEVSASTGEGRHTTVNSVMLALPGGGAVIDSPGVRDFAPALQSTHDVAEGFREIMQAGGDCRFADCRHLREPDCAVKAGVDTGEISERRYESYKRLEALTAKLENRGG